MSGWLLSGLPAGAELIGHGGAIKGIAITPDGRQVLTAGFDYTVILWDLERQTQIRALDEHEGPVQFRGAYNTTKYALEGLTDTLRLELMGTNIHVSLIEPGPIDSLFRKNALTAFEENISAENSPFENAYKKLVERLRAEDPVVPFTLGPEAVLDKVVHALESKKPKPVTMLLFQPISLEF